MGAASRLKLMTIAQSSVSLMKHAIDLDPVSVLTRGRRGRVLESPSLKVRERAVSGLFLKLSISAEIAIF
jgi:hypothetical protein